MGQHHGSVSLVGVSVIGQCYGSVSWVEVSIMGQHHGSVLLAGVSVMGRSHGSVSWVGGPVSRVRFHGPEQIKNHGEHTAKCGLNKMVSNLLV